MCVDRYIDKVTSVPASLQADLMGAPGESGLSWQPLGARRFELRSGIDR